MDTTEEFLAIIIVGAIIASPLLPAMGGCFTGTASASFTEPAIINSKRVVHVHSRGISFPVFAACIVVPAQQPLTHLPALLFSIRIASIVCVRFRN